MTHYADPARAQFDAFKNLPRDTPIQMLNLIRFRDRAGAGADRTVRMAPREAEAGFARPYFFRPKSIVTTFGSILGRVVPAASFCRTAESC